MANDEKKGITVKVDAELHTEVRRFLDSHGITMAEFVSQALQNELHPKNSITEVKDMGNMRTLAFQVPEDLFRKIKDYLQRNNMTQKEFIIGLVEREIELDLAQQTAEETTDLRECEETEEQYEEQNETEFGNSFDGESEENENPIEDEDLHENEEQDEGIGMSMGM